MIESELVVEREGWAAERAARVTDRLQHGSHDRFETVVIWSEEHTAFTGPGRTLYFSRRLLERMPDDDAAAFVIAHELAHHRLGHIPAMPRATRVLPLGVLLAILARRIAGPERERDADLLSIEMCVAAGYAVERCSVALELMHEIVLDYGDVDGALGPETGNRWWWARGRGYFSVAERLAAVRAHAASGAKVAHTITRDRERRRRYAALASTAVAAAALLWLRRR